MLRAVSASLALAMLLPIFGGVAIAQSADPKIAPAMAEFERNNVGTSPQTRSELIRCAAFWAKWSERVSENYSASQIAQFPAGMRPEASKRTYDATFTAAVELIGTTDAVALKRADEDFSEQYEIGGFLLAANLLSSANVKFFATLGSCGTP